MHPVVAQAAGRRAARSWPHRPTPVQVEWRGEVVDLSYPAAHRAVLELQPHLGGMTVGHVHPERRRRAGAADDGRRQRTCPVCRGRARSARRCAPARCRRRHRARRARPPACSRGPDPPTGPVVVVGGDAESPGEFDQRGRELSHAAHLASNELAGRHRCDPTVHLTVAFSASWVCSSSTMRSEVLLNSPSTDGR